jgi:hydroxymethylglutaryl-CoA reductase (NADPH)
MTRAPVFVCKSAKEAHEIQTFCENKFDEIAGEFNSTSNYARLQSIKSNIVGKYIFLRFKCTTGDAMGMNMACKGTDKAIDFIMKQFPIRLISLSSNACTDKKPSAVNWIEGRGKSVVCEAVIKKEIVEKVLKTSVDAMIEVNYVKNMIGSSVAGSIGGNNAHASNIVTAMFIACGQDVAQNVESSNCMTIMEKDANNQEDLYVSVTLPSLEVGTVGGGTNLSSQSACLKLIGVHGADDGANSSKLASIISSGVLAGEISLIAALSSGHLLCSHMKLNRKQ